MQRITDGNLRVLTFSHIYTFPSPDSEKINQNPTVKAELRVVNDVFWVRMCTMADLGFAEAYMYGDVECDDLVSIFLVSSANCKGCTPMADTFFFVIDVRPEQTEPLQP